MRPRVRRTEAGQFTVASDRQLLSRKLAELSGVKEYFDIQLDTRLIQLRAGSEQDKLHSQLTQSGVSVFKSIRNSRGDSLLIIPDGSRSVNQALPLIARDVRQYSKTFTQIGRLLSKLSEAGIGGIVPSPELGRGVLHSLAFVMDDSEDYGGNVYLSPPYALSDGLTTQVEASLIATELRWSGYYGDEIALSTLMNALDDGINQ